MTEPTDALLPCPFCGSHALLDAHADDCYFTLHSRLKGSGGDASLVLEAHAAWNRRTPAPVGVEPVAWRVRRLDSPNYWIIFLHKPVDALMDPKREVQPLYTAPQPTQAQAGAVPPEAEPIVLNCEAPGDLKPGDYVFASRWSDCDPGDPWEVGFVSEVGVYPESMTKAGYVVLHGGSRRWGRAMRITPEQGRRICEQFPSMERLPQDYDAIARVFGIKGGQHGAE